MTKRKTQKKPAKPATVELIALVDKCSDGQTMHSKGAKFSVSARLAEAIVKSGQAEKS